MVATTYISRAHDTPDLFHRIQIRAQAAVHGKDLFVNNGSDGQAIETVRKCFPELDVVPSLALVVKAVNAIDRRALVVATQDEKVLRILDLVCEQQADCLERLLASIHVVAQEEVVCLWWKSSIFEETEQIVILAVNITANLLVVSTQAWKLFERRAAIFTLMGASSSSRIG